MQEETTTVPRPTAEHSSPLMRLPPELRNAIYRSALVSTEPINLDLSTIVAHKHLLDTCTAIRREAASIFWAENNFSILVTDEDIIKARVARDFAGASHCQSITRVVIRFKSGPIQLVPGVKIRTVTDMLRDLVAILDRSGLRSEAIKVEDIRGRFTDLPELRRYERIGPDIRSCSQCSVKTKKRDTNRETAQLGPITRMPAKRPVWWWLADSGR